MNLYLVFAIALGAITGVVEAPVLRPVHLVTARDRRVQQRAIRIVAVRRHRSAVVWSIEPRTGDRGPRPFAIAAPRAPAVV